MTNSNNLKVTPFLQRRVCFSKQVKEVKAVLRTTVLRCPITGGPLGRYSGDPLPADVAVASRWPQGAHPATQALPLGLAPASSLAGHLLHAPPLWLPRCIIKRAKRKKDK